MKVKDLVKKLNKRDKEQPVYFRDKNGYHEITSVEPCIVGKGESVTLLVNGDGGRYES